MPCVDVNSLLSRVEMHTLRDQLNAKFEPHSHISEEFVHDVPRSWRDLYRRRRSLWYARLWTYLMQLNQACGGGEKNCTFCCCHASWQCWVSLKLCFLFCFLWTCADPICERTACCLKKKKKAQTPHWGELQSRLSFPGPFAKHLGCRFPSSASSVVPLTCVVHSCSPLLS